MSSILAVNMLALKLQWLRYRESEPPGGADPTVDRIKIQKFKVRWFTIFTMVLILRKHVQVHMVIKTACNMFGILGFLCPILGLNELK